MQKNITRIILTAAIVMSLGATTEAANNKTFKPESNGYRLNIPVAAQEIYHTTTGIRFVVGKNQLVSADIYSMPNFISVPIKQYSDAQKKDLTDFIKKTQDFADFTFEKQAPLPVAQPSLTKPINRHPNSADKAVKAETSVSTKVEKKGTLKSRLEAIQKEEAAKEAAKAEQGTSAKKGVVSKTTPAAPKVKPTDLTIYGDSSIGFAMDAPKEATLPRNYLVGKAYQLRNDKLLVVTVASPKQEKGIAQAGLSMVTSDLKLSKPHYPDENLLTSKLLGMSLELPVGWHAFTLKADNIIMARTLSGVHNDGAMIRAFRSNDFNDFAKADSKQLAAAEKAFIEKLTKFTPNVSIVKHEAIHIDGMNGSIIQSTDSDDLKKIFILNAYLFSPDGLGYQMRFSTDDTINYDLKLQAFTAAIKSFKKVKQEVPAQNTSVKAQGNVKSADAANTKAQKGSFRERVNKAAQQTVKK